MNDVWYASYGSNLNKERFLCYICGGKPSGSRDVEIGCRDQRLPKQDQPILLPYPLYFAEDSKRWGGAPAFLGHQKVEENLTLGRIYRITKEQFLDVVKQENGGQVWQLDLEMVKRNGAQTFLNSWYGHIVYVGEQDGLPIYTFTAPWSGEDAHFTSPSKAYLTTIIKGINECYELQDHELVQYFQGKPGVKGNWTDAELTALIQNCRQEI